MADRRDRLVGSGEVADDLSITVGFSRMYSGARPPGSPARRNPRPRPRRRVALGVKLWPGFRCGLRAVEIVDRGADLVAGFLSGQTASTVCPTICRA